MSKRRYGILLATVLAPCLFALPAVSRADDRVYDLPVQRGYAPLRPVAECLDPDRARAWHRLSGNQLIVDSGRRAHLLTLSHDCPGLGLGAGIGFVSRNPGGRICGDIGDTVIPSGPPRTLPRGCHVARVTVLTEAAAKRMIVSAGD